MTYKKAMKLADDAAATAQAAGSAARGEHQRLIATAVGQLAQAVAELAKSDKLQAADFKQANK